MTDASIHDILIHNRFPGTVGPTKLIETHISWVILTPDYAFKIKKPVKFNFLDFSNIEKRRFYCEAEWQLNRRLAPEIYLGVLPVGRENDHLIIGAAHTDPVDFAVWMKRMDENTQMDLLLSEQKVTKAHLEALAQKLSQFHYAAVIKNPDIYHSGSFLSDFEDLYSLESDAVNWLGTEVITQFTKWRKRLPHFLQTHAIRLRARFEDGFWVDGHGDLHTRNIFLGSTPFVFDCIEFNPAFRRIDILNELAFLCMDLEAREHPELSSYFIDTYCRYWQVMPQREDTFLFLFFKAYRANVRLKICLLELRQQVSEKLLAAAKCYWSLLNRYCDLLFNTP